MKPVSQSLAELGFLKKGIVETIVCTEDAEGAPNAAPMGVTTKDFYELIIRPFIETKTYRNLVLRGCGTINITSDPAAYYRAALKGWSGVKGFPKGWFERAKFVAAPRLKEADAWIEVDLSEVAQDEDGRARVVCRVVDISVRKSVEAKAYCRAKFAVIESVIHATRIDAFASRNEWDRASELARLIEHYHSLVIRVAPGTSYDYMMDRIVSNVKRLMSAK